MKRIRIVGLCIVAAFAFSVVAATSASAALPEFEFCQKVKAGTGAYTDSLCSKAGAGNYEVATFATLKNKKFKAVSGRSKLETVGVEGAIECKKSQAVGKYTGPKEVGKDVVRFKECESTAFKVPCESATAKHPEEIVTSELGGELGYIEEATKTVGTVLAPESSPYSAEFECPLIATKIRTSGAVIGLDTENINAFVHGPHQIFGQKEGIQDYTEFEGGPEQVLKTEFNDPETSGTWQPPGGLQSGEEITAKLKGTATKINA